MKELEIENSSLIKVLEAFPVCYVLLTTSFKIINASDTYLENVSLKREHIIGKDFFKFFGGPPGSPEAKTMERLRASFEKIRETFVPDQMEVQRYDVPDANDHHKVKHSYWLPINTPVLNADNELQYIIHQVNNVTKLVEIEEQYEDLTNSSAENIKKAITIKNVAEAEKQKLYSLFMQAPAIIAVLRGPQHIFELANPRYMQLVGVNRQLIGKPVREALPEGEGQGFFELLDEVYKSGKPFQGNEVPLKLGLKEDGTLTEVFINFIYQPALDANEKVYGILVHAVEVTEQVQIRRRIEESEDKYRRLFTQMDQGFCIIEMIFDSHENPIDYIFIETNPVFESQTGLKDAAGKTVRSLVPELESRWFERYGNVALTGESVRFTEGSEAMGRWFEVNAFRLGGAESKKVALLFSDITERKKAEESLRLSNIENERLAAERTAIVNQLTEGVVVTDTDGNIVLLNDAAANLHGTSDVNVRLEQHCERYNLFTMDGRRYPYTELPLFKALLKEEIVLNESWWIQRPNGTKVLASGSARPVYANDGAKIGAVLTFRDDTERKIAEQALIESEMRFRTLADEAPVFIFLADEKANVHFWNKTYQEYTGLFGEASLTDSWQKMIHPDDLQSIQHTYLKAAKDRQAYTGEWRLKNKEGHYRWILFQGYPRYTAEGEFIGYMGSGSDIHRSKEAEGILKESEQRLSLALQATRDGIWDWDFINDKAWWDSRYAEITGTNIPEEERSLSSISRFIPADDVQKINDALQAHVEKGKKFEVEFRAIQPSGDIRNVFAKGKAVMDKVGKVIRLTGTLSDITELKKAENKLKMKNEQLTRVNNDLDNFIYTASHDLKAPISNLEGLLNAFVSDSQFDPEQLSLVEMMFNSIERFKTTIKDLTDITKLQRADLDNNEILSFHGLLEEVKLDIRELIENLNATIHQSFEIPEISYSRKNLRSIIYNLLSNALKYSSPERRPEIKISSKREHDFIIFEILDNGLGLSKENQSKIFGMFKRAHQHIEGSGIGLYIIKKMVENAGGKIEVESEVGMGTTFKVYLKVE